MKLIVGLGNPTKEYRETKHNLGFKTIEAIAKHYNIQVKKRQHMALIGQGSIGGTAVVLVKPMTYVNRSGDAVDALIRAYEIDTKDLIIICDDLNLEPGMIRIRRSGSHGGHKGLKSIIESLGTDLFPRLRIGIGKPEPEGDSDLTEYVLGGFTIAEKKVIEETLPLVIEAVEVMITSGIEEAMHRFNRSQGPSDTQTD